MAENKNQHYIAQSYLREFVDDNHPYSAFDQDAIWLFDRKERTCKLKGLNNILCEPYYYSLYRADGKSDNHVEKLLSRIESSFIRVVSKIKESVELIKIGKEPKICTQEERAIVVAFIVWQIKRTPKFRTAIFTEHIEKQYNVNKQQLTELKKENPVLFAKIQNEVMYCVRFIGTSEDMNFFRLLMTKNLVIYYIDMNQPSQFITADDPILITNNEGMNGLIYQKTEVAIPITKKIALTLYTYGNTMTYKPVRTRDQIRMINIGLAKNSTQFIVGGNKDLLSNVGKYC